MLFSVKHLGHFYSNDDDTIKLIDDEYEKGERPKRKKSQQKRGRRLKAKGQEETDKPCKFQS